MKLSPLEKLNCSVLYIHFGVYWVYLSYQMLLSIYIYEVYDVWIVYGDFEGTADFVNILHTGAETILEAPIYDLQSTSNPSHVSLLDYLPQHCCF